MNENKKKDYLYIVLLISLMIILIVLIVIVSKEKHEKNLIGAACEIPRNDDDISTGLDKLNFMINHNNNDSLYSTLLNIQELVKENVPDITLNYKIHKVIYTFDNKNNICSQNVELYKDNFVPVKHLQETLNLVLDSDYSEKTCCGVKYLFEKSENQTVKKCSHND